MKVIKKRGKGMRSRRVSSLERLEVQLKKGSKPSKEDSSLIPLTDKDKSRIGREIEALKTRLV